MDRPSLPFDFAVAHLTSGKHLGAQIGAQTDWIRGDMRRLPLQSAYFDAAMLMDAFGFFETDEENETVLAEIARVLVAGGRLCVKVVNGSAILADFRSSDRQQRAGAIITISRTLNLDPPCMTEKIAITGSNGSGEYERRQRLYRYEEMYGMLERAGFALLEVCASVDGTPFESATSMSMWLVCERSLCGAERRAGLAL